MPQKVVTGQLSSFAFTTVAIALKLIEIEPSEESIGVIPVPDLSLAVGAGMPYEPMELVEGGEYKLTFADDQNTQFVHEDSASSGATFKKSIGLKQTCTWTKAVAAAVTSGATRAFTGIIIKVKEGVQKTGERNTIEVTVKVSGTITKTAGA